jgi:hypothetical protein
LVKESDVKDLAAKILYFMNDNFKIDSKRVAEEINKNSITSELEKC